MSRLFDQCQKVLRSRNHLNLQNEKDNDDRSEENGEDDDLNVFVDNNRKKNTSIGLGINHKRQ